MSALLTVDGLDVRIGSGALAVRDVSFALAAGESVGIVGESGSGKSLTCRSVLGVLPGGCSVAGGHVHLDGTELTGLGRRELDRVRATSIGAVFQDPASYLNPSLTVGRQLAEQVRHTTALRRRAARDRAVELLAAVGLRAEVRRQYPHELSGGMLQRVLVAIALAGRPKLLVADEPTTALDVAVQAEVLELLAALRSAYGLALLLVSHDLAVVAEVCDRVIVMYAGEIVESGPVAEVIAAPRHPYTRALLRVASLGDWTRRELDVIPGQPPQPGAVTAGCRFADRCAHAIDACTAGDVALTARADRSVRCVRADELAGVLA
jgi:peptide/nickel transport system ATP-binding protein